MVGILEVSAVLEAGVGEHLKSLSVFSGIPMVACPRFVLKKQGPFSMAELKLVGTCVNITIGSVCTDGTVAYADVVAASVEQGLLARSEECAAGPHVMLSCAEAADPSLVPGVSGERASSVRRYEATFSFPARVAVLVKEHCQNPKWVTDADVLRRWFYIEE